MNQQGKNTTNNSFLNKLLRSGCTSGMTEEELKQTMLTNSINIFLGSMTLLSSIMFLAKGEYNRVIPTMIFTLLMIPVFFLNRHGYTKTARFILSTLASIFVTIITILRKDFLLRTTGEISALEYTVPQFFTIAIITFPLMLFHHKKEKYLLLISLLIVASQAVFGNLILKIWGLNIEAVTVGYTHTYMIYFAPLICIILISGAFFFFKKRTYEAELSMKQQNESLLTTEEELRQNLEELSTTQERLAEHEKSLQSIFDALPHPIFITELHTGLGIKANSIAEKLFAPEGKSLVGLPSMNFYKDPEDSIRIRAELKEKKSVNHFETTAIDNNGIERDCHLFMRFISYGGNPAILGSMTDLTEVKQMQKEIETNNLMLQAQNDEMMTVQEELRQNMEETQSQRDFIEKSQKITEKRNQKISRHTQILMSLSKNKHIQGGDYLRSVEVVISSIAKALNVDVVSAWEFAPNASNEHVNLNNILTFESYSFKVSEGITAILPKELPFMKKLNEKGILTFDSKDEDPTNTKLIHKRFEQFETHQMVILPTYNGHDQSGIVLIEKKSQSVWAEEDLSFIKSMLDVLSLAKNNEKEVLRQKMLDENNEWLLRLNKSRFISNGNWNKFLEEVTRACTKRLKVEICSIWKYQFEEERELLKCDKSFNRDTHQFENLPILSSEQFPEFFQSLSDESIMTVTNVIEDHQTYELKDIWEFYGVKSMIQMPIFMNGKVGGVLNCMTKSEAKEWSEEDRSLVKGLASLITVAIQTTKQANQSKQLQQKNQELEQVKYSLQENNQVLEQAQTELKEKAQELYYQHENTLKSIKYAETIQRSFLPTEQEVKSIFPDSFVLYKAKDIVSGDFYWMSEHENGQKLLGVIDCTGHGVPGGFVSLVGHNVLKEIIFQKGITDPAQILPLLHKGVVETLNQNDGINSDGMDLGLCLITPQTSGKHQLTYAGSKSTIYYTQDGLLQELKSDKWPIGGRRRKEQKTFDFTNQSIEVEEGSMIYMATDGFQDQNNANRKKFSSAKLKELMLKSHQQSAVAQLKSFENALHIHQGEEPQRDDITLVGVRL